MARRSINWSAEVAAFKADRAERSAVREERLRTTAGLRGSPAIPLSAWRGRSGRRYVVRVNTISLDTLDGAGTDDVAIFVRRDDGGCAHIVGFCSTIPGATSERFEILRDAVREGASEMHVHRLCIGAAERRALVSDLTADILEAA